MTSTPSTRASSKPAARPKSPTEPSTRRLSEVARHVVIPTGIVTTAWPRVVAKCREVGVEFDGWQHGLGTIALGKREDGLYAATEGGVVLSIPRQVGKTFFVGMVVIALCLLNPGMTVLWTAHRTRTATKTFHSLKGMTDRPKFKALMLDPRLSNGEQEIRFRNKSVIMFGAREQGFGRGFDQVDVEVFDEAQILTEKALEDMVPATNQSKQAAGALLFFMGTPPRPSDPGEEFAARRRNALTGQTQDTVYVEMSADENADPNDREQWAKANPSYPARTPLASIRRMRAQLTNDASFLREGLGVWDEEGNGAPFPLPKWLATGDPIGAYLTLDQVRVAVDMPRDRDAASVTACGRRHDGVPQIEVVQVGPGSDWVVDRCVALKRRWRVREFVVDGSSAANSLVPEMQLAGLNVTVTNAREMAGACGVLYDAVRTGSVRHVPHELLKKAVEDAKRRPLGDAWALDKKNSEADISPLVAAVLAHWALTRTRPRKSDAELMAGMG